MSWLGITVRGSPSQKAPKSGKYYECGFYKLNHKKHKRATLKDIFLIYALFVIIHSLFVFIFIFLENY